MYTNLEVFFSNFSFLFLFMSVLIYWIQASYFPTKSSLSFNFKTPNLSILNNIITFFNYISTERNIGILFTTVANGSLFLLLVLRWIDSGHFPLSNLYESLMFLSWSLTLIHLFIEFLFTSKRALTDQKKQSKKMPEAFFYNIIFDKKMIIKLIGSLTAPCALFTNAFATFSLPKEMQEASPLVPALQSNWLMMHVTVMILSYAALILGSLLSIGFLVITKGENINLSSPNEAILIPSIFEDKYQATPFFGLSPLYTPSRGGFGNEGLSPNPPLYPPFRGGLGGKEFVFWLSSFALFATPLGVASDGTSSFGASLKKRTSNKAEPCSYNKFDPNFCPEPFCQSNTAKPWSIRLFVKSLFVRPKVEAKKRAVKKEASAYVKRLNKPYYLKTNDTQINNFSDVTKYILTTSKEYKYNLARTLDNLSYRILGFGFPLLTIGILSGAVWANEAWGSYWSWDPKETWALLTWLVFAIYLHTRLTKGWEGKKPALIASLGFITVWICFLGVNLIGEGLHSYGWINA